MAATTRNNWLSATDREAALGRIGCAGLQGRSSAWNIVDWFVRLARNQKPFSEMASVEVESLRQEYRALQEVLKEGTGGLTQNVVPVDALEKFRSVVRQRLDQLADTGQTTFGPFAMQRFIYMSRQHDDPTKKDDTSKPKLQVYSGDHVEPFDGQALLYHLSGLIGRVGLGILRCPHCKQVFLRPRADADHCSRTCQARAYAQSQRDGEKAKKSRRKRTKRGSR